MAKVKMTLAEALVRKKTYEKKITALTSSVQRGDITVFVDIVVGESKTTSITKKTIDEFNGDAAAALQSINATIENYYRICRAINKANNTTKVTIAGETMTIVDAIVLKSGVAMDMRTTLADYIKYCYDNAVKAVNRNNDIVNNDDNVTKYLNSVLSDEARKNPEEVKSMENLYHAKRDAVLVDPLGAVKTYSDIYNKNQAFADEVDIKLSEVNATTTITVDFVD